MPANQPKQLESPNQPSNNNEALATNGAKPSSSGTVTNLGAKSLIVVPEFATIDELASALVLGRLLQRRGEKVVLYFGLNNYPPRLQKIMPAGDLKFYQPKQIPNEFVISLKVPPDNKIQGVRWEQSNDELHIFIEPSQELVDGNNLKLTTPNRLGRVYLVGSFDLKRLENYPQLAEFFAKHQFDLHYLHNQQPPFQPSNNQGLIAPQEQSLAGVIEAYAKLNKLTLESTDLDLLNLGRYFNYLLNGSNQGAVPERPSVINNAELSITDFKLLNNFWQGGSTLEVQDLADFLALIKLTPQLNPLNSNFGTFLKNKPEGMSFAREAATSQVKIIINDELRYQPETENSNYAFRRFKDFLIVRVNSQPKEGSAKASTSAPATAKERNIQTKQPLAVTRAKLNDDVFTPEVKTTPKDLTPSGLTYGKPKANTRPEVDSPPVDKVETTLRGDYIPLPPAQAAEQLADTATSK